MKAASLVAWDDVLEWGKLCDPNENVYVEVINLSHFINYYLFHSLINFICF
jgi:hypothetical protein